MLAVTESACYHSERQARTSFHESIDPLPIFAADYKDPSKERQPCFPPGNQISRNVLIGIFLFSSGVFTLSGSCVFGGGALRDGELVNLDSSGSSLPDIVTSLQSLSHDISVICAHEYLTTGTKENLKTILWTKPHCLCSIPKTRVVQERMPTNHPVTPQHDTACV